MFDSVIPFIIECDKLKAVLRRTIPVGLDRPENSAEHSWSLALLAISLIPEKDPSLDVARLLKMLLIHDIVEIDAGDTFFYTLRPDKAEQEQLAATRIFSLLPETTAREFIGLWKEFEAAATPEAAFANGLDRLLPMIQNFHNGGRSWKEHGVTFEMAHARNQVIKQYSAEIWNHAEKLMIEAKARGFFASSDHA